MKNCYQPYYLQLEDRWVIGLGGNQSKAEVQAEINRLNAKPEPKPMPRITDIPSGFGIGGIGSEDYNIGTEIDRYYRTPKPPAGTRYAPTGTTEGERTPGARCDRCGRPADWNPSAGEYLCEDHWDEY